jgi:hypothetical protein
VEEILKIEIETNEINNREKSRKPKIAFKIFNKNK